MEIWTFLEREEEGKGVEGSGVVWKIGGKYPQKRMYSVAQKFNLTRVRMNYLRWQVR